MVDLHRFARNGSSRAEALRSFNRGQRNPVRHAAKLHTLVDGRAAAFHRPPALAATPATAAFVDRADLGLRAGDALHLAVAAAHGCIIATLDIAQASAAPACNVPATCV